MTLVVSSSWEFVGSGWGREGEKELADAAAARAREYAQFVAREVNEDRREVENSMVRHEKDDVEHLERALIVKAMLGDVTDDDIENLSRVQSGWRER